MVNILKITELDTSKQDFTASKCYLGKVVFFFFNTVINCKGRSARYLQTQIGSSSGSTPVFEQMLVESSYAKSYRAKQDSFQLERLSNQMPPGSHPEEGQPQWIPGNVVFWAMRFSPRAHREE